MVKKIALEEHFMAPGLEDYWAPTVADVDRAIRTLAGRIEGENAIHVSVTPTF